MQLTVGALMLYISLNVQRLMDDVSPSSILQTVDLFCFQPANNVVELTTVFTMLVTFSATQGNLHSPEFDVLLISIL